MKFSTTSPDFYEHIGSLELALIWESFAEEIMPKLSADEYYVVPYPDEAKYFQLFQAFDKFHPTKMAKICKLGRTYKYLSHFRRLLNAKWSNTYCLNTSLTTCETSIFGIPDDLSFATAIEEGDTKILKKLTVSLTGMRKQWGYVDRIDNKDLVISRKRLPNKLKRIYVINEVIVADSLDITATCDANVKTWNFVGPIPLAFKFTKVKFLKRNYIAKVNTFNTLPRWSDLEKITWERPCTDIAEEEHLDDSV